MRLRSAVVRRELVRAVVRVACLVDATEPRQQLAARRVIQVIVVEARGLRWPRARARARATSATRDGTVEPDDRRRRDGEQLVVEREHLPPVGVGRGRGVAVHRVDRGLDLIRAGLVAAQAIAARSPGLRRSSARSHRLRSWSRSSTMRPVGARAGGAPRLGEQEQREQSERLGFVGHEVGEQAREPDRFGAQVGADQRVALGRGVALVEDRGTSRRARERRRPGSSRVGRHAVRDLRVADLLLRAHEALRHRRFGHEERACDVRRLESAEQPKGERDLRARRERRVTAGEDESEPVVVHVAHRLGPGSSSASRRQRGLDVAVMARRLTTQAIDRTVAGRRGDPAAGIRRQPVRRPPLARDHERVLDRLFGDVDVTEETDQGGDDSTGFLTEDPFERRLGRRAARPARLDSVQGSVSSWNGRTSTGPMHAADPFAAQSSASSRSAAVMIQKPPRCSFVSANGPSVMIGLAVRGVDDGGDLRRVQTAGEHPRARVLDLFVEPVDLLERLLPVGVGRLREPGAVVDGKHVHGHCSDPFVWAVVERVSR